MLILPGLFLSNAQDVLHTKNPEENRAVRQAVKPIRTNYRQVNYDPAKITPYTLEDPPWRASLHRLRTAPEHKLLIAGFDNPWFDTEGEYLACKAASPAWKLHGKAPFPDVPFPADFDTSAIGPSLGYYRRSQEHGIADFDWLMLMRFAERAE